MHPPRVHNGLIPPEALVLPPFPSKPFTDLIEDDLRRLIEDQVGEDVEIDYKVALETSCQEFARDVSAFANTKGGYLVYGMAEEGEIPTNLVAIPGFDSGRVIGQLTSWAQEHIRPRPTLRFKPVSLSGVGEVLVVEVPRSWIGPHEVRQEHRFYHRTQHGKAPMDVDQLRMAFNQEQDFLQAADELQARRLDYWKGRTAGLGSACVLFVLHLLPADGLLGRRRVDISGNAYEGHYPVPHPAGRDIGELKVWRGGTTPNFNLEGYAFQEISGVEGERCSCQVFRNGGVEHKLALRQFRGERAILAYEVDQWLDRASKHAVSVMKVLEAQGPVAVVGSLVGAQGWAWTLPTDFFEPAHIIEEPLLRIPEALLDSPEADPGPAVEQLSRGLWNAMGKERSPFFEDGEYRPR